MIQEVPHNQPTLGEEEIKAVSQLLRDNELTLGRRVREFEKKFSGFLGLPSAAVASGTAALHLALILLGVEEGDEVVLPSYTCASVGMPILYLKAKPVFAEIDDSYNLSPPDFEKKITEKTKAVILPHMFGYPANIEEIMEICDEHGVYLIEDCAQAIGASYKDRKVGTFGDISIFSFYATKMITSIQGGMISSKNKEWIETVKEIRYPDAGSPRDKKIRYSYMMSDISATIGMLQLQKLDSFIKKRRKIASIYRDCIKNVIHPVEDSNKKHVFFRYMIRTRDPGMLVEEMRSHGVVCSRMYLPPLHKRSIFDQSKTVLRRTEEIAASSLSLPIFPSLKEEIAIQISEKLNAITRNG